MEKDQNHHQLIGKSVFFVCTFLFSSVLVFTILILLTYNDQAFNLSESANETTNNEIKNLENLLPNLAEDELKAIKDDKNLKEFLDTLNSLIVQESQRKNQRKVDKTAANNSLKLEQDWQLKNSLGDDVFAQRLSRIVPAEDDNYEARSPIKYPKVYRDDESATATKNYVQTYSDDDYYDKLNDKETIDVYDKTKAEEEDISSDEVRYYLIRKQHNHINLASQHEIKGLNQLIINALSQDHLTKYQSAHQPNIHQHHHQHHQQPPVNNLIHHGYHSHENWASPWNHHWPRARPIPYSQLTLKQRVKINLCERMLRKVNLNPNTLLYTNRLNFDFNLK